MDISGITDIDECVSGIDDCLKDLATCTNTLGSFTCACIHGYNGDGKTSCVFLPEGGFKLKRLSFIIVYEQT